MHDSRGKDVARLRAVIDMILSGGADRVRFPPVFGRWKYPVSRAV